MEKRIVASWCLQSRTRESGEMFRAAGAAGMIFARQTWQRLGHVSKKTARFRPASLRTKRSNPEL
jgi:hypothetical protein